MAVLKLLTWVLLKACTCEALSEANAAVDKAFTLAVLKLAKCLALSACTWAVVNAAKTDGLMAFTGVVDMPEI